MPRQPSRLPPEIARHRLKGTRIVRSGAGYCIQRVTSRWDKEAKKVRKVVLEHIGTVTPEGIVPKKTRRVPAEAQPVHSKEFGATWAAGELSADLHVALERHFPGEADWMYVCALLRCIRRSAFEYTAHFYATSWLSERFPGLALSSQSLSRKLAALGRRRREMVAFMREFVPSDGTYLLVDGSRLLCSSGNIRDAQRGWNSRGSGKTQLNLLYALAFGADRRQPVFFKRYPGSVPDVSAFRNLRQEAGMERVVVVCDKGFGKEADEAAMEAAGVGYVIPLRRNSLESPRGVLEKPGFDGFDGRFLYNGRVVWHAAGPADGRHRTFLYLDEDLCHEERSRIRGRGPGVGRETPAQLEKIKAAQKLAGTFCLKTTLLEEGAETVYRAYKSREEIEQLFDTYKDELDFATTGMHGDDTLEGCLFLNHLALLVAYKVHERLRKTGGLGRYAAVKMLGNYLWDVRKSNAGGTWQLEPIPKSSRKAILALGLIPPDIPPNPAPRVCAPAREKSPMA
ncbi:MAG: transposase [Kiritimatiellae bacterium]|nr:transposase [Kiritimatiellia bacterium]